MAYPINTGDIAEVTIKTTVTGQTCLTVLHYRLDTPSTIADGGAALLQLLNALNSATGLVDTYAAIIAENTPLNELRGQMIRAFRWNPITVIPNTDLGTFGTACTNPSAAAAITKRGEAATRSARGTIHMPALAPEAYAGGLITNEYATSAAAFLAKVALTITPATGRTWIPIIYNRSNPAISEPIVSVSVEPQVRTMRRRVVGRGI